MIARKTTRIIGIILVIIGLSVFGTSYYQGLIGQKNYSKIGCVVDMRPSGCGASDAQMTSGFIGMIFAFFTALFGVSLVIPATIMKLVKVVKGR